ncbi:hypothetical protein Clacol_003643 [Clathrus columnatus]|uniref:G-patch domain-containing protein n=1 Tax=Clathrus columnatus TaxID=1419009 RepID=A0AAV5A437_9AGAM|nr:hypothetical protein Clacol_003643 [Clathrus columnatus]
MSNSFLRVDGRRIVDVQGNEVVLRGAGLGGWMNMENFINERSSNDYEYDNRGYPGREFQARNALAKAIGSDKSNFFFDKRKNTSNESPSQLLEYFFTDADAQFFKSLGLNCLRLPFNYKHFEDDLNPRQLKQEGFKHLDRVIDICAKNGIWTVLDLHAVPGHQNGGWHSDNPTHYASFWDHRDFQDRAIWLWEQLAERYKDNAWVAGYNPLNEPADSQHKRLLVFYNRIHAAIRAIDNKHILFLDGNTYAADFSQFGDAHKNWSNTVYAFHDYSGYGFPSSPETYTGTDAQKARMRQTLERKIEWMTERSLSIWNGEFGPVYARTQYDGAETPIINKSRYLVLEDQLRLYDECRLSWSIWLYKDVDGFQGMVYSSPDSAYSKLFGKFLLKKQQMGIDTWGTDEKYVKSLYEPLEKLIKDNVSEQHQKLYPPHWIVKKRVAEFARHILVAEYLVAEWAEHFVGKSEVELDELAASFSFENCVQRKELNSILREYSHRPRSKSRSGSTTPPPAIKLQGDPDSSDDDDNVSLVSRSPSPKLDDIMSYDEHHPAPEKEIITVDTKIKSTNKGYALLSKLGWSDGQPLGRSKDGRVDPIPFYIKNDLTGLGKRAQDERMVETTVSHRRELVSERQIRETSEERQSREVMMDCQSTAEKEVIANQIATTLRHFYCSLCDKQYQTVAQYDEHTNSYAHHHKQRFKDMQANAKGLNSNKSDRDSRLEKERKREEKEFKRMAKARGVKVSSITVPTQKVDSSLPSSSIPFESSKGFKSSGWSAIPKQASEDSKSSSIATNSSYSRDALANSPPPPPEPAPPLPPPPPF